MEEKIKQYEKEFEQLAENLYNRYLGQFTTPKELEDICIKNDDSEYWRMNICLINIKGTKEYGDSWCFI